MRLKSILVVVGGQKRFDRVLKRSQMIYLSALRKIRDE